MSKFIITEEEKSRILGMHKDAIAKQYLSEQGTPVPTTTTQTTQPQQPTQQAVKKQFIVFKKGDAVGGQDITQDIVAVITKLNGKNGTYYDVQFTNTPGADSGSYVPGQQYKVDHIVNADPKLFGITTTDRGQLNAVNAAIAKKITELASSL